MNEKTEIVKNLFWKFLERIGAQGIQFIVQIFLARLLFPSDYGTMAIVLVFINIANVFIQMGFSTALVQAPKVDSLDLSTVLFCNLFISSVLYLLIFAVAPIIASFYDSPQLVNILRVFSTTLFFGSFGSILNALVARKMKFRLLFLCNTFAVLVSGFLGIFAAINNLGVWALVIQQLAFNFLSTPLLFLFMKWRPTFNFSMQRLKNLFSFGWKVLVASLIETIFGDIRSLFIGKIYTSDMLGYYSKGQQFPMLLVSNINGSIQSVIFPVLSSQNKDILRVKSIMRKAIQTSSYIVFPLMIGLAVTSEPLVLLLLTDRWASAIPFLRILCFSFMLWPIHTANLQAINALGRSDIYLKLEIIKKILSILILAVSLFFNIYIIAIGEVVISLISAVINSFPNKKLLNYSRKEQMSDIFPALCLSIIMGILVYPISFLNIEPLLLLFLQATSGSLFYFISSKIFKIKSFYLFKDTLVALISKKKK